MKKRSPRKPTARTSTTDDAPPALRGMTTQELLREIRHRENNAGKLIKRRAALVRQLEAIDAQLGKMKNVAGRTPRARNSFSLVEALKKVLAGKQMGIPQIIEALPVVGYRSESPNLRTMVNVALLKKDAFTRVERGVYTAK